MGLMKTLTKVALGYAAARASTGCRAARACKD